MKTAADDSWLPPDEGLGTACDSCGRETLSDRPGVPTENYRVHDHIWQQVQPARHLCIGCAERRLGRPLNRHDFPDVPVNDPSVQRTDHAWSWRTPRLQDRLTREAAGRGRAPRPHGLHPPPPAAPGLNMDDMTATQHGQRTQPAPVQLQHLIHAAAIGGHPRSRPAPVQPPGPGHDPDPGILEGPDR